MKLSKNQVSAGWLLTFGLVMMFVCKFIIVSSDLISWLLTYVLAIGGVGVGIVGLTGAFD